VFARPAIATREGRQWWLRGGRVRQRQAGNESALAAVISVGQVIPRRNTSNGD